MRQGRLFLLLVMLSLTLNRCSQMEPTPRIAGEGPHFHGEIMKLFVLDSGMVRFLAEGQNLMNPAYVYDEAAMIDINENTRIYQKDQQGYSPASVKELAVGQSVEVFFTGPIQESWPVHGTAGEIVIVEGPSTNDGSE